MRIVKICAAAVLVAGSAFGVNYYATHNKPACVKKADCQCCKCSDCQCAKGCDGICKCCQCVPCPASGTKAKCNAVPAKGGKCGECKECDKCEKCEK